jgi:hypothetical protein
MKNKSIIGLFLSFLVLSCFTFHTTVSHALVDLTKLSLDRFESEIVVTARVYLPHESHKNISKDFHNSGHVPIELTIHNSTGESYELSQASVPLACITHQDIAWHTTKKSIARSVALKIASLIFFPISIPSMIDGIATYNKHKKIAKDVHAKSLKEEGEVIPPYATVKRILVVKTDEFRTSFSVALKGTDNHELVVIPTDVVLNASGA